MITEDLVFNKSNDWLALLLTGSKIIIQNNSKFPIKYRFGFDSESDGNILNTQDIIIVDNDVYIQSKYEQTKIQVSRDII